MIKIFFLIFISVNSYAATFNSFLAEIGIQNKNIGDSELKKSIKVSTKKGFHYILNFEDKNNLIYDLEFHSDLNEQHGLASVNSYTNILFLAYGDKPTPYPGETTNVIKCANKYKPKIIPIKKSNLVNKFYVSFAGSRFQYGVCDKKDNAYYVCSYFFYNKQKSFFGKIKIFSKVSQGTCEKKMHNFVDGLVYK